MQHHDATLVPENLADLPRAAKREWALKLNRELGLRAGTIAGIIGLHRSTVLRWFQEETPVNDQGPASDKARAS
jgi:hypothetical protein